MNDEVKKYKQKKVKTGAGKKNNGEKESKKLDRRELFSKSAKVF